MRTKECEKLFDSVLSEDPIIVPLGEFTKDLMKRDGFDSLKEAMDTWFNLKYGNNPRKAFVVLRWE